MPVELSWPAGLTLLATVGTVYLASAVWPYRDEPGGRLFIGAVLLMALTSLLNGLSLLVTGPAVLREALEIAFFIALLGVGALWLPFAFVYTGRNNLFRRRAAVFFYSVMTAMAILTLTNPFHNLFWSNFEVTTTLGAAGATYARGPAYVLLYVVGVVIMGGALLLLLETLLSYGSLYRSQVSALAATNVITWIAFTAYVLDVGPVPALNLIGLSFLPHAVLDGYALFYGDMFVFHPSTRRIGESAAIDEVGNPIFVVDTDGRIITLNEAAAAEFDLEPEGTLGVSIDEAIDGDSLAPDTAADTATLLGNGTWREYDVTTTPLEDETERAVGHTITLNDVTAERQRQQRLEVFNRVLRHNLRNDLSVVICAAEEVRSHVEHDGSNELLDKAISASEDLVELGNQARMLDQLLDGDDHSREVVRLEECLHTTAEELKTERPEANVVVECETEGTLRTNPQLLSVALKEAAENGIEHNDCEEPTVRLSADRNADTATFTVRDDGPGLPSSEIEVIETGMETDLSHGSGLGLWSMAWCVQRLGGELTVASQGGTTVQFELPARPPETQSETSPRR